MDVSSSQVSSSPVSSAPMSPPSSSPSPSPSPDAQQSQRGISSQSGQNRAQDFDYGRDEKRAQPESARDPLGQNQESEAQKEERRRWQLKASGRDWDLGEDEVVKYAQKGIDADQKWQEAARMREDARRILTTLREDPMSILTNPKLGLDFEKIATDYLAKKLERDLMDPNERRAVEAEERLKSFEEREAEAREQELQAQREEEDYAYQREVDNSIRTTLQGAGLPLTEFTYDSTIKYMQRAMKAGYKDVTAEGVLPYVQRDFQRAQEQIYALPEDQMLSMIGEKALNRIQEAYIKKVKGGSVKPEASQSPQLHREAPLISNEGGTMEDWRQRLRRNMGIV